MKEDLKLRLDGIRSESGHPIVAELLEIQKYSTLREDSLAWVRELECLTLSKSSNKRRYRQRDDSEAQRKVLRRNRIDAFEESDYVAVSYTHVVHEGEDDSKTKYSLLTDGEYVPSKVRDAVLDRVVRYTDHKRCGRFWIDQECIDQANKRKKEVAMQSMDFVYSLSRYPVALLSVQIVSGDDLNILTKLMRGQLTGEWNDTPVAGRRATRGKVLELLKHITDDRWWTRAWTYQEDYRASVKMVLLVPHARSLEVQKDKILFGALVGELCINAVKFRTQVTRVCNAYRADDTLDESACTAILERAAKYTEMLGTSVDGEDDGTSASMSPLLLKDLGARDITNAPDILAIAANCCQYAVRLDTARLGTTDCSLSVAVLALTLLNGEILLNNGRDNTRCLETISTGDIFDFLTRMSMNTYRPPVDKKLTFIKGCRFVDVKLSDEGVKTAGHLWRLSPESICVRPPCMTTREDYRICGLTHYNRRCLQKLMWELRTGKHGAQYKTRTEDLESYLDKVTQPSRKWRTFSNRFKTLMAVELAEAIGSGKRLRLGCLAKPKPKPRARSPYRAIFVDDDYSPGVGHSEYVFTSFRAVNDNDSWRDLDKHVSLNVTSSGRSEHGLPKLLIDKWVNGLLFFDGCKTRDVVFPWPKSLSS